LKNAGSREAVCRRYVPCYCFWLQTLGPIEREGATVLVKP